MDYTFFSSELGENDYRIFRLTSLIIQGPLTKYALIGLSMFLILEAMKMIYLQQMMDFPKLLLAILLFVGMKSSYTSLIEGFDHEMNALYSEIKAVAGKNFSVLATETYKGTRYEKDVKKEVAQFTTDDEKLDMFDEFLTGDMSAIIYKVMIGIRKVFLLFLYAIGPVVITLSMFPIFGIKVLKNWFFYLLGVHLWELCFIILQLIQGLLNFFRFAGQDGPVDQLLSGNAWAFACANIGIFFCFAMVPYLTSKMLIGLAQPSSFASRTIGAAAMATRGAIQSYKSRQASQKQSGEGLTNYVSQGASSAGSKVAEKVYGAGTNPESGKGKDMVSRVGRGLGKAFNQVNQW